MTEQYSLYAIMKNRSRYILKTNDYYLTVLLGFTNGEIDKDVIELMNTLTIVEMKFLQKVVNGECSYSLLKSIDSKIIRRIETKIFSEV